RCLLRLAELCSREAATLVKERIVGHVLKCTVEVLQRRPIAAYDQVELAALPENVRVVGLTCQHLRQGIDGGMIVAALVMRQREQMVILGLECSALANETAQHIYSLRVTLCRYERLGMPAWQFGRRLRRTSRRLIGGDGVWIAMQAVQQL